MPTQHSARNPRGRAYQGPTLQVTVVVQYEFTVRTRSARRAKTIVRTRLDALFEGPPMPEEIDGETIHWPSESAWEVA